MNALPIQYMKIPKLKYCIVQRAIYLHITHSMSPFYALDFPF